MPIQAIQASLPCTVWLTVRQSIVHRSRFRYQCNEGPLSTCQTICHCNIFSSTSHHESPDIGELLLIQAHFVHLQRARYCGAMSEACLHGVGSQLIWMLKAWNVSEFLGILGDLIHVRSMIGYQKSLTSSDWGPTNTWYTSSQDADQLARAKAWN